MLFGGKSSHLVAALAMALTIGTSAAQAQAQAADIRINEISDKGTDDGTCNGGDWIELYNPGSDPVDLAGYVLHDDGGPQDDEAFTFPAGILEPDSFLVLCAGGDEDVSDGDGELSVPFGIGGSDQVTLLDPSGAVVSSTGVSLDGQGDLGITLAYDESTDSYAYTLSPTPGAANVITGEETVDELKARLTAQNELGIEFFDMDVDGKPVEGGSGYPAVVDLRMFMDPADKARISGDERGYEVYSPFSSAQVTAMDDPTTVFANLTSPGRIRPKGQSTMYLGVCTNRTTPYQVDWDSEDETQNLFGSTKTYLRTAFSDPSFVREWASHRMLARFGLPHLRTRTVRLLVNDEVYGLYNLMEAPDQDYVFHRGFPDFDPENYGLYKVKTQSIGCGSYDEAMLARAEARKDDDTSPPYIFERGEHRPKPPVIGDEMTCFGPFIQNLMVHEQDDIALAYVRSGAGKCGDFLVDMGLVDRDLGDKSNDELAAAFIDDHLADNKCDENCENSNLADDVDVDQMLRNFATQAVLLHQDSPLGNGNNWYIAYSGNGDKKWSMLQYDHNNILSSTSALICDAEQCLGGMTKWSILRPTCRSLESNQMAGPLLTDESLLAEYVEYVREFIDDVATNEDLLQQIADQMAAIKDLTTVDPWNQLAFFFESHELAAGEKWLEMLGEGAEAMPYIPFLPALRARTTEVQKQLDAIGAGTYPRSADEYNPGEACANWEAESPPDFPCHNNCYYEGCSGSGLVGQAFCDPESKSCFTGLLDFDCIGVPNGELAPGSTSSFCLTMEMFPVKATPCPPPVDLVEMSESEIVDEEMPQDETPKDDMDNGSSGGEEVDISSEGGASSGSNSIIPVLHLLFVAAASLLMSATL